MPRQHRNAIRGPTVPDKANDRAGNAAVRETDRGGSGIDQPSRASREVLLAPAASVGGGDACVKFGTPQRAFERTDSEEIGVAGKRADFPLFGWTCAPRYEESGTPSDE